MPSRVTTSLFTGTDKPGEVITTNGPGLYGRYLAAAAAAYDLVYTQDDDCVTCPGYLVEKYLDYAERLHGVGKPWRNIVLCNMPQRKRAEYRGKDQLVGWGSVFHKEALQVFETYFRYFPKDELFQREADRVFTWLNRTYLVDEQIEHLPEAFGKDRLGAQAVHLARLASIRERLSHIDFIQSGGRR